MALYEKPLSQGGELLTGLASAPGGLAVDVVIVGSGYGGSVAAARLTERIAWPNPGVLSVCVLERGLEHLPGSFPHRFSDLPGHVRVNRADTPEFTGDAAALFDLRIGEDVSMLLGNGLGGGSLINASVAERPNDDVFDSEHWPACLRKPAALDEGFRAATTMLGVGAAKVGELKKHAEFIAWTERLGLDKVEKPRPANIAVYSEACPQTNAQGVDQHPCNNCGDCFTGCNFHAKNTLPMNYLAQAAKGPNTGLYTGVTVSRLRHIGRNDWEVFFHLTPRPGFKSWQHKEYSLRARHVILAAGAMGSTEILMRSRAKDLTLSDALGRRFSCNGDMIGAVYAQTNEVNACAKEDVDQCDRKIGPTITGVAQGGEKGHRFTVEELAVPSAFRRIFEEVVTTAGLPYRLGGFDSAFAQPSPLDPLAVDSDAVERTQVIAAMGQDGARGKIELIAGWDAKSAKTADGIATVKWAGAGLDSIYAVQDKKLSVPTIGGGDYLRSPAWQPLPPEMSDKFGGKKPEGKLFTVHPLGGCPMADSAEYGVVNDIGQVYSGTTGKDVYGDLLVLDGSIIPTALGINPLFTITALAERAIQKYIEQNTNGEWTAAPKPQCRQPVQIAAVQWKRKPAAQQPTALRFAERVEGELRLGSKHRLRLTLPFEPVEDVPGFLGNPSRKLVLKRGVLTLLRKDSDEPLDPSIKVPVTGTVGLLEPVPELAFERTCRALFAFLWRRGVADFLQQRRENRGQPFATLLDILIGIVVLAFSPAAAILAGVLATIGCWGWPLWLRIRRRWPAKAKAFMDCVLKAPVLKLLVFVPFSYQIGETRRLRYDLVLEDTLDHAGAYLAKGTRIVGEKILRYSLGSNPCWQLYELPATVIRPWHPLPKWTTLRVDLNYFFRRYAAQLQITRQRDLPNALLDVGSTVATLLRIVAKVHFWSFRLPEYAPRPADLPELRAPGRLDGLQWERHDVSGPGPKLRLTHYWCEPDHNRPPVVLFHGLGASGNQFATPKLETNLVQHLALAGRDVWVAEMRHSIALPTSMQQWTLDDIALHDVPRLIEKVRQETRAGQVDVVAHCIGSAMFCTAALAGKLGSGKQSWINAAVLLQVGLLIELSPGTRARAHLAAFLRRYMKEAVVDFSVDASADWMDSMIDRLLATYPFPPREARRHSLMPPWEPHLHIANCNRWAAIDGRMIEHRNLGTKMLESLGEILGPANLTTWEQTMQFAYVKRLTSCEGRNYVTPENIEKYLDFPIRFIHGEQNDVFSPETSRRSCALLRQVLPTQTYDVIVKKGYSHLDPLIGEKASSDIYPDISGFLAQPVAQPMKKPRVQPEEILPPLIGPVVGWTRKERNTDPWRARIWCRIDDTRSPAAYILVVVRKPSDPKWLKHEILDPYAGFIDTLAVCDVELDRDDTDYEIFVASVHAAEAHKFKLARAGNNWTKSLQPDPKEAQAFEAEVGKRVGQLLSASKAADGERTTDENYDGPLYRAFLRRRVLGDAKADRVSFAFGSCRYGSTIVDRERADAVYGRLRRLVERDDEADRPSLLLLVGDQIYADQTGGVFDPPRRRERFYEPYREAWTAPHARAVLSQLPTYMMLDDHEVADNWHPLDKVGEDRVRQRLEGLQAFQEYQLLHSPRYPSLAAVSIAKASDTAKALPAGADTLPPLPDLWYDFKASGFPFFVLDTRGGRTRDKILSAQQLQAFKDWLEKECKDKQRPKFVVSPSVLLPFCRDSGPEAAYAERSDGWDGYPASLCELFQHIWRTGQNNVVFLCGDAHLSMASRVVFIDGAAKPQKDLRAFCIVSSGFYAPFPFANSQCEDYLHANGSRPLEIDKGIFMHYEVVPDSCCVPDNFTIVEAKREAAGWSITMRQHGDAGLQRPFDLTGDAATTQIPVARRMHVCS